MRLGLEGRTALVSGASRGIGLAIARMLYAEGCQVALMARRQDGLDQAAGEFNGEALIQACDVTNAAAAQAAVAGIAGQTGGIDMLVCNAGSGASVPPGSETEAEWRRVLDVNLFAALNTIAAARPHMRRGGAIVCISSIASLAALGAPVAYSGAKAALNAVTGASVLPSIGTILR